MPNQPNILYIHSHDTGRYVQPYGHQIPTPNIQRLADQGLLFRQAYCAAPSCSGSRACLLTGQWAHVNGMTGLAHRGWELDDYGAPHRPPAARGRLLVRADRRAAPVAGPGGAGLRPHRRHRHHRGASDRPGRVAAPAQPAARSRSSCRSGSSRPTAASSSPARCATRSTARRPSHLPDTPETRLDMASFKASARSLDQGVGRGAPGAGRAGPGRQHAGGVHHRPRAAVPRAPRPR